MRSLGCYSILRYCVSLSCENLPGKMDFDRYTKIELTLTRRMIMSNRGLVNLHQPRMLIGLMLLFLCHGCAAMSAFHESGWATDYDTAERRVAENSKPLFIYYGDTLPTAQNPSMKWENDPALKPLLAKVECCRLYHRSVFDRRYVAQFGVLRAPSVIVVRSDGTYHAKEGIRTTQQLTQFLGKSDCPGYATVLDPHIVRRAHYDWIDNVATARRLAQKSGKPLLVAYVRRFSRDWGRINKLLKHHMVYRQLRDTVMCRIDVSGWTSNVHISEFGVVTLPSVVLESPDGRHEVLQQPTDYEAVATCAARMHRMDNSVSSSEEVSQNIQAAQ